MTIELLFALPLLLLLFMGMLEFSMLLTGRQLLVAAANAASPFTVAALPTGAGLTGAAIFFSSVAFVSFIWAMLSKFCTVQ